MKIGIVWHRFYSSVPLEGVCVIVPEEKTTIDKTTGLPENAVEHWFRYNPNSGKYDIMSMTEEEVNMANEELKELKVTRGNTLYHNLLYNHRLPMFDASTAVTGLNGYELPLGFRETKLNNNLVPMNKIAEVDLSEIINSHPPMMALKKVSLWK
jgi:hypothetical protein